MGQQCCVRDDINHDSSILNFNNHPNDFQLSSTFIGDMDSSNGIIKYANGDVYEGEWKDGLGCGRGKIVRNDGSFYCGNISETMANGFGIEFIIENGMKMNHSGYYIRGSKNGFGQTRFSTGSVYIGYFEKNMFHGFGIYYFEDGKTYEGHWNSSKYEGWGRLRWKDGRCYEGEFLNDARDGFGIFTWVDGRKHIGFWRNGLRHGTGVFLTATGFARRGNWVEGERTSWENDPTVLHDLKTILTPQLTKGLEIADGEHMKILIEDIYEKKKVNETEIKMTLDLFNIIDDSFLFSSTQDL